MAVDLRQRGDVPRDQVAGVHQLPDDRCHDRGECCRGRREPCDVRVPGQLRHLVGEHHGARWLQSDDRQVPVQVRAHDLRRVPEHLLRHLQLAGGVPGQPAAHEAVRDFHGEAERLQDLDRGDSRAGPEGVVEGVRPQHNRAPGRHLPGGRHVGRPGPGLVLPPEPLLQ